MKCWELGQICPECASIATKMATSVVIIADRNISHFEPNLRTFNLMGSLMDGPQGFQGGAQGAPGSRNRGSWPIRMAPPNLLVRFEVKLHSAMVKCALQCTKPLIASSSYMVLSDAW